MDLLRTGRRHKLGSRALVHAPVHQTDRQAERPYKPEVRVSLSTAKR